MVRRIVSSFQMTEADQRKFDALEKAGFGTRTDIIRTAVDRMYQEEVRSMAERQAITIDGRNLAIVEDRDLHNHYELFDGGHRLGIFHFSDGHNGLMGYSNGLGKNLYVVSYVGRRCVYPKYAETKQDACELIYRLYQEQAHARRAKA